MNIIWIALAVVAVLVALVAISAGMRRTRSPRQEVHAFKSRTLTAAERDHFQNDWHRIEMQFVDRPGMAVAEAEELISAVRRARGMPVAVIESQSRGQISTEGLRQAMLHYRALFDDVVNAGFDVEREIPMTREVSPKPIVREPAPDEYPLSREEVTKR